MKVIKKIISFVIALSFVVGVCSTLPVTVSAVKESESFSYLGTDTTTKNKWEGKYGNEGYVLLGYRYVEENGENSLNELATPYVPINKYDLIGGDILKNFKLYLKGGTGLAAKASSSDPYVDMPLEKDAAGYPISAIAFATDTGDPIYDGFAEFQFELKDDEEKIFSVYAHDSTGYGSIIYQFYDPTNGKLLYSKTFDEWPAYGGSYASFKIKGSFNLRLLTEGRQNTVSSFFFDDVKNNTANLQFDVNATANSIDLNILDEASAKSYYIVRNDGEKTDMLCQLDGNEKTFADITTIGSTKYTYTLYRYDERGFSKSKDFTFNTPSTMPAMVQMSPINELYNAGDIIPLKISAKVGSSSLKNIPVKIMLAGDYIDYGIMEPMVAEVILDDSGEAVYEYAANVGGNFDLYAVIEQNYSVGITTSESERSNFTVKLPAFEKPPFVLKMSDAIKYDELISVAGEGYTGDLQVKAKAFAGNDNTPVEPPEDAFDVEIVQKDELNGQFMVIKFPKETPSGLYSIWIKNDYGWSEPYTLNESRANFISEYEVRYGMEIQVSGRNLDLRQLNHENHYTAVRLNDGKGNMYVQELTKVTPYSLKFKVDERTPLGTYDVEVTNNGGLSWTGLVSTQTQSEARKQRLTVLEACEDPIGLGVAWVANFNWDNVHNVTDYGANGKDENGDIDAIKTAIKAVHDSGGGVVYIPNGTYYIDDTIPLYAGVVIRGQDREKTVVVYNGVEGKCVAESTGDGREEGRYGLCFFTLKAADEYSLPKGIWHGNDWEDSYAQKERTCREIFMKEFNLELNIYTPGKKLWATNEIDVIMKERYVMQDCYIRTRAAIPCVYVTQYVTYDNCVFEYGSGYLGNFAMYSFETNMKIKHATEYPSEHKAATNTHGYFGRSYIHWENCDVEGMGYWGDSESFCSESPNAQYGFGKVLYAEENKVYTYLESPYLGDSGYAWHPQDPRNSYLAICIVSGRGAGQLRAITDFDSDGNWFEIHEPWDVMPDSSSIFSICLPNDRTTIYKSNIDHSGTICSFYGVSWDNVADSIIGHNVSGFNSHNTTVVAYNRLGFGYFTSYRNSEMSGCMPAIPGPYASNNGEHVGEMGISINTFRNERTGKYSGIVGYGLELRNLKVTLDPDGKTYPPGGAINFRTKTPKDDKKGDVSNVIVENCYTDGGKYGVSIETGVGNGIVVRNLTANNTSSGIPVNIPEGTENYIHIDDEGPQTTGKTLEYNGTVSSTIAGAEVGFEDLENVPWAKEDIELARQRRITSGTSQGKFSPEKTVTRAEFIAFIVKAMGIDLIEYRNVFSDVSKTNWYATFIQTAYTNALIDINMINDGKINPENPITREEMASVLARAVMNKERTLSISAENAGFNDMNDINGVYTKYVNVAKKYGIVIGDEKNNFKAKALANRAEAVVTVNRFFDRFMEVTE